MEVKYLAVEIKGEIFVMNDNDELGGLIDGDIPHTVIGRVCTERCNTTCLHYRGGTCPCKAMKDADGILIHVFVDNFWFSMYFITVSSDMCPTDSTK